MSQHHTNMVKIGINKINKLNKRRKKQDLHDQCENQNKFTSCDLPLNPCCGTALNNIKCFYLFN